MAKFDTEREGQIKFYETFIPRVDPDLDLDEILADDNDGVINGNLLEFKLIVTDLNAVLFQCIKYLSARRLKGEAGPCERCYCLARGVRCLRLLLQGLP